MREILFRGKTKDTGEWVVGTYLPKAKKSNACIMWCEDDYIMPKTKAIIPETVGQYTGLTDNNGKKIFEGDIVKSSYKDGFEIGLIGWSNIDVRYKFASPDGTAYGIDVTDTFEVIGNIHDNPEFLKESEDKEIA